MLPKVAELIDRPFYYTISFEYSSYGRTLVDCQIRRNRHGALAVRSIAGSDETALSLALALLEDVQALEKLKMDLIRQPPLEKQRYEKGYYRECCINDWWVEYKRLGNEFVITRVYQQDEYGFQIEKLPYSVATDNVHFKVENQEQIHRSIGPDYSLEECRKWLKDGEELWIWNNIRALSGSAGFLIVKDGMILRQKGVLIS